MEWTNIRKLSELDLINEIETLFSIVFPDEYRQLIFQFNAGIPKKNKFLINNKEYRLERLISARKTDSPNVLSAISWLEQTSNSIIVPIALDENQNLICIEFFNEKYEIVFIDFETAGKFLVSKTVIDFINSLY